MYSSLRPLSWPSHSTPARPCYRPGSLSPPLRRSPATAPALAQSPLPLRVPAAPAPASTLAALAMALAAASCLWDCLRLQAARHGSLRLERSAPRRRVEIGRCGRAWRSGSRFSNLCKVEFNYSGWKSDHGMQLDNQGLHVLDFLAYFKKLVSLRLNTVQGISSAGLLSVAVGCKRRLSSLHLTNCKGVSTAEWLEYLGRVGSLEELVVKYCEKICQYDLLKFGPGWMKLQKFEFQLKGWHNIFDPRDPSYVPNYQYRYDFLCEHLKDLTLAKIVTQPEIGLRYLLRKCKALENLRLHYVLVLSDNDMITLIHSCSNLRSISLRFEPLFNERPEGRVFSTPLTDESLKALALRCPMLQTVELIFAACEPIFPSEIGFTQEGFLMLIKSCPIRDLILCGANFFNDEGMKALSSARYLDTLELMDCVAVTDVGMRLLAHAPRLTNLTLRQCDCFTDNGVGEVVRAHKLESLIVEGCSRVSVKTVLGAAKSVHYKDDYPGYYRLDRV
nr:unnamed protein product [Digitaria exilis]